jgi:hypothetical protein
VADTTTTKPAAKVFNTEEEAVTTTLTGQRLYTLTVGSKTCHIAAVSKQEATHAYVDSLKGTVAVVTDRQKVASMQRVFAARQTDLFTP